VSDPDRNLDSHPNGQEPSWFGKHSRWLVVILVCALLTASLPLAVTYVRLWHQGWECFLPPDAYIGVRGCMLKSLEANRTAGIECKGDFSQVRSFFSAREKDHEYWVRWLQNADDVTCDCEVLESEAIRGLLGLECTYPHECQCPPLSTKAPSTDENMRPTRHPIRR
jgi:hypothetical protein